VHEKVEPITGVRRIKGNDQKGKGRVKVVLGNVGLDGLILLREGLGSYLTKFSD